MYLNLSKRFTSFVCNLLLLRKEKSKTILHSVPFIVIRCTLHKHTRMHSSRMRTGRSLTGVCSRGGVPGPGGMYLVPGGVPGPGGVYLVWGGVPGPRGGTWFRGVYLVLGGCTWSRGGVPGPGGYLVPGGCTWPWGVYLVPGGVYLVPRGGVNGQVLPPVNRMTNRCKNITLAKTSFRPVKTQLNTPILVCMGLGSTS